MTKVSIITASYNYAEFIGKTIESVISQTFQDWEMVIIDDGSKDNSVEVIKQYLQKDNRIKLLSHLNNENKGLIETLKLGLSQAKGEYIVFLESDDYIKNDYLEKKLAAFEKYAETGFIYNDIQTFGAEQTGKRKFYFRLVNNYWKKHNYPHNISDILHLKNYIPTFSCVMLKKDLMENINWTAPDAAAVDWCIWAQICSKAKVYYLQEKLTYWRLHSDSYLNSSRKGIETDNIIQTAENIYKYLPPVKSFGCKLLFILKIVLGTFKYRRNLLPNIKYIFKRKLEK